MGAERNLVMRHPITTTFMDFVVTIGLRIFINEIIVHFTGTSSFFGLSSTRVFTHMLFGNKLSRDRTPMDCLLAVAATAFFTRHEHLLKISKL